MIARPILTLIAGFAMLAPGARALAWQAPGPAGERLGKVDFPVSCSAAAQAEFNRAVALLHHMTYPGARDGFERVAAIDSGCAMAHWGVAMTLFQPLWPTRPGPADLARGWEAVRRARALGPPTEREQLFVEATAAFFEQPESPDYWARIRRWATAMGLVYAAFPRDPEVAAFYGLSQLAMAPADTVSRDYPERAARLFLEVYNANPDHPGAMHYLVHANDAPGRQAEDLAITRKYETAAPRNPHALHMPTHIYTRLGEWDDVIRGNLLAAEAALEHPAGDRGQFVWDEFPHALEYLVYAYLQQGADDKAAAAIDRLVGTPSLEPTFKTAFHLASTRARYALERRDWDAAVALSPRDPATLPWDRFPWPEAVTHFARGLGAVQLGNLAAGRAAVHRLDTLEARAREAGEELFTRNIRILRLELGAWLAHAGGETVGSVRLLREAAALEASTPKAAVTPAPTLPAQEMLGDLLGAQDDPRGALDAYRRSLEQYPRRLNSLLGAARAARALGDLPAARGYYRAVLDAASSASRVGILTEARTFIGDPELE